MSPKELLYIDDALGHTQFLMTQCREPAHRSRAAPAGDGACEREPEAVHAVLQPCVRRTEHERQGDNGGHPPDNEGRV